MTTESNETSAVKLGEAKGVTCNCRADIEAKLTKQYAENTPEASEHNVELQGYGIGISGNSMYMCAVMPYKATAIYPIKKGGHKTKKLKGSMHFNFCPFCGKSAK